MSTLNTTPNIDTSISKMVKIISTNNEYIEIFNKDKKGIENRIKDWVTDCFHGYK